jgi:hypothetical protein
LLESASAVATWSDVIKPKTGVEISLFLSGVFSAVPLFESWVAIVIDGPL